MMPRLLARLRLAAALLAATAAGHAAVVAGGTVYSKRYETTLLSDPQPLAKPAATLALGRKLKVEEVRGIWLRVRAGAQVGWVFAGNVSESRPAENKGLDGLPLAASPTTATAAARPLAPAAADYAVRRHLGDSRRDLDWLLQACHAVTPGEVEQFLLQNKKGEYQ